ncbi:hypothetical protein EZL74_04945 [Flavobacterium silvisoli]|uniref:Uncharacterized protein n=1 Tax=Flavobacterium silvisoli TaxID=2529433 RepID=A0A4Q9Z1U7_9FLAO|nr:hypothetical protein [Flavobacterium silvisoli]TBX70094.1 hypothetical protein EZL74_04945 [Flavobacterium silvisoli]
MKRNLFYLWLMIPLLPLTLLGQGKKSSTLQGKVPSDNIYMTWNKSTPETEMNDDVKALAEHGVTITYSDVKRNEKGEITAIKVSYSDANGSKGSLEFDNKKPINTIKFYKQNDEVGFGEPSSSEIFGGNSFLGSDPQKMMKEYHFNFNDDKSFPFGNGSGKTSSRIIIQKDGKKPLVLEDGNVVEGGDDYTAEELEEIKKNNKVELFSNEEIPGFQFNQGNNFNDLAEQMKKMQEQIDQMMSKNGLTPPEKPKTKTDDLKNSKAEMQKAKEEMLDAKKEMEKAKKELEKAKSALKTQKA